MDLVAITLEGRALRLVPLPDGGVDLRADEGPPGPDSVFERIDMSHGRIALRVPGGRYLARHVEHAGKPTDLGAAVCLADELTQCAAFEEVLVPDGFVSLRACDLRFLGVHTSGRVVAGRISNGTWERFRYLRIPAPVENPSAGAATAEPTPLRTPPAEPGPQPRAGAAVGGAGVSARSLPLARLAPV